MLNFKNYEELNVEFSPEINCLVGENGSGKTNLLDAIHYLTMSKSAFGSVDVQHIRHGELYFTIQGNFQMEDKEENVLCGVQNGQKKVLKLNKVAYEKISDHIGRFPTVLIAPNDSELINEGSEERRKYFDSVLSQIDHPYLSDLILYNHILQQRNSLLKQFAERKFMDKELLAAYDAGIIQTGRKIYLRRKHFAEEFEPLLEENYLFISDQKESISVSYSSDFAQKDFENNFRESFQKDVDLQRTTLGAHKDDYLFKINTYPLKKYGSQGQQKSFLIALKLALFQLIDSKKNKKPILLLDDIFDKLDEKRMNKLIQLIASHTFGQVFITDATPERAHRIFNALKVEKRFFLVQQGSIQTMP